MESKVFRLKRIRAQIWRLLPIFFLFLSLLIMIFVRSEAPTVVRVRSVLWDCFAPIVSVVRQPVYWVKNGVDSIKNWTAAYHENELLKQENQDLKKWYLKAVQLEAENTELKRHLSYNPPKKKNELTAQIVMDEGGAFSRSFMVMAGKNQGIVKGMLGFGPVALFGRIVEVGDNYSRLMPLTDYMSRVPVYVGKEKKSAFLMGDNTDMPYLQFQNEEVVVQKGDVVISSGYMGIYPPNLPIGRVYAQNEEDIRVVLFENINVLTFVHLFDFGLTENLLKKDVETP